MKKEILSHTAPLPIGAYSQAVYADGWLFLSGQIPLDPKTKQVIQGDIGIQTEMVMKNIKSILAEKGMNFNHIIKVSIFIKNMGHFAQINEVYSQYFNKPFPARSCVAVKELPKGVDIEIECIAYRS